MKCLLPQLASLLLIGTVVFLSSCIRDEAENAEADILTASVEDITLSQNPVVTNSEVRFYVNAWDDRTALAPTFTITEGATIEPASGTVRDFTTPQTYTVTSQDGQWKKTYQVSFLSNETTSDYHFDRMKYYSYTDWSGVTKNYFHILYELPESGDSLFWSSGNAGFMITSSSSPAEDYPTALCDTGYVGKCAKLVTRSTGYLGQMFKAPIAAGNIFLGDFQIDLSNTALSTHFGVPYIYQPLAFEGYYKYTPGSQVTDKNLQPVDKTDSCSIYAVFYEVTDDVPYLNGTNSLTSENIVLKAELKDQQADGQWHHFVIEFEAQNGKTVDAEKLKNGQYSLAIVASSSKGGATYVGAVGSTLYVDEFKIYHE
ncbi:MAG: PCMD domain-containing protein [Prevotella sp.]